MNIPVKLEQLSTLLTNLEKGILDPDVGFEDCERTAEALRASLNRIVMVPIGVVESALWSCVLLDEKGAYVGESLDGLVKKLTPTKHKFNREICMWEEK